jgi:phosphate transport system substrate-binding protein
VKKLTLIAAAALAIGSTGAQAQLLVNGAGSTFDTPALTAWFDAYGKIDSSVHFNYQSIGSGGGVKQLVAQTVDFGASDYPMTDAAMAKVPEKILHIPVVAGAVAITYNLPGDPKLKFDGPTLAGIYLGKIAKWNDPAIAALNPDVTLPDQGIVVVHRSDGSGTTYIFTDYLSAISPDWASGVGKAGSVKWPVGLGGKGSTGVAGQVKQLPGAMGYVELAYAEQNKLPFADMKNAAGEFVTPSPDAVSKAMATATIPDDFRFSMVNAPGSGVYPISGASWILVYQKQTKPDVGGKLIDFLKWAVTDGQKITPSLDYAPLPDSVQQRELQLIATITTN